MYRRRISYYSLLFLSIFFCTPTLENAIAQERRTPQNANPLKTLFRGDDLVLELHELSSTTYEADVRVTVGNVSIISNGSRTSTAAGDLSGVALSTARGSIYHRAPELTLRALAVSKDAPKSKPAAAAPETPSVGLGTSKETWVYDIQIAELKEFRLKDGTKCLAIDATLQVLDGQGKLIKREEFHKPDIKDRFTDEQFVAAMQSDKEGTELALAFMENVSGMFPNLPVDPTTIVRKLQEDTIRRRLLNYQTSNANLLQDYQIQEVLIREAVSNLIRLAPLPGQKTGKRLAIKLKTPRSKKDKAVWAQAADLFERKLYEDAARVWESIPEETPEKSFNLGAVQLVKAVAITGSQPLSSSDARQAWQALELSEQYFQASMTKFPREMEVINTPIELKRSLESLAGDLSGTSSPVAPSPSALQKLSPPANRYALLIGIGTFADPSAPPLPAARKDTEILKSALLSAGFPSANIVTLVDTKATLQEVRKQLDILSRKLSPDSLVVISISSHGSPPDLQYDSCKEGYILCYDSRLENLFASAYPVLDFREHIDRRLPSNYKIVIQDTCHSASGQQRLNGGQVRFVEWPPRMAVLAACDTNEEAAEISESGIFTAAVASVIKKSKGRISVAELGTQVQTLVRDRAQSINHTQNPQIFLGEGAAEIRFRY